MDQSRRAWRSFLVEAYLPAGGEATAQSIGHRLRDVTASLGASGTPIRFESGLLIPGDEVVFYLFRSPTLVAVNTALADAGVTYDRIAEAVPLEPSSAALAGGSEAAPATLGTVTSRGAAPRR